MHLSTAHRIDRRHHGAERAIGVKLLVGIGFGHKGLSPKPTGGCGLVLLTSRLHPLNHISGDTNV